MASSTLFVADLPGDVKESDLSSLFRNFQGYATSRLRNDRSNRVVGFVDFETAEQASAAKEVMEGRSLHPDQPPFRLQFAKQSRSLPAPTTTSSVGKRPREDDSMGTRPPPAVRADSRGYPPGDPYGDPPRGSLGSAARLPPGDPYLPPMHGGPPYDPLPPHAPPRAPVSPYRAEMVPGIVPPEASSTLYVENVPSDATQREMSHIFRPYVGFQSVRLVPKEPRRPGDPRRWLCFVEFDSKYHATLARNSATGYRMDKDDARGLGVDFAKTRTEARPPPHAPEYYARDERDRPPRSRSPRDGRPGPGSGHDRYARDDYQGRDHRGRDDDATSDVEMRDRRGGRGRSRFQDDDDRDKSSWVDETEGPRRESRRNGDADRRDAEDDRGGGKREASAEHSGGAHEATFRIDDHQNEWD